MFLRYQIIFYSWLLLLKNIYLIGIYKFRSFCIQWNSYPDLYFISVSINPAGIVDFLPVPTPFSNLYTYLLFTLKVYTKFEVDWTIQTLPLFFTLLEVKFYKILSYRKPKSYKKYTLQDLGLSGLGFAFIRQSVIQNKTFHIMYRLAGPANLI